MTMAASAISAAVTPRVTPSAPVSPVGSGAVKPVAPSPASPVSPIKPIASTSPGAISPVSPIKPVSPGNTPLKPSSAAPIAPVETNKKSGTAVVKNAPPKETARITVKPNFSSGAPAPAARPTPSAPAVKPAGGAPPVVAAAGARAVATPSASTPSAPIAPPVSTVHFQEDEPVSTKLTTCLAGALAVLTWAAAGLLLASAF